jgi:hypothetical protein
MRGYKKVHTWMPTPTCSYTVPPHSVDWIHNGGARVEMVYRGTGSSGAQWTESRTPATAYTPSTGSITMASLGFIAGLHKPYNQALKLPEYYQNAFELLGDGADGKPGDWYLDIPGQSGSGWRSELPRWGADGGGFVYYVTAWGGRPKGGEQCVADYGNTTVCCGQPNGSVTGYQCPATAPTCVGYLDNIHFGSCVSDAPAPPGPPIRAVLPQLETLIHGAPGLTTPSWVGVTFAEATWLRPSTDVGFVELQAVSLPPSLRC